MRAFFCLPECCGVLQGPFASRLAPTVDRVDQSPVGASLPRRGRHYHLKLPGGNPIHPLFQPRDARLKELPALAPERPGLRESSVPRRPKQPLHFVIQYGKRRPVHLRLVVVQGNHQAPATLSAVSGSGARHSAHAFRRRQCDQRGAIIQCRTIGYIACGQLEEITAPQFDGTRAIDLERPLLADVRIKVMFVEEILDGLFRQLDAQYLMAFAWRATADPGFSRTTAPTRECPLPGPSAGQNRCR